MINLPDTLPPDLGIERVSDAPLAFKLPTRDALLASANRLLKFEFPISRDWRVHERLIKAHMRTARLSKRTLDALPAFCIETIYRRLWTCLLDEIPPIPEDTWITLLLLSEELTAFDADNMMREDIRLLGQREAEPLHSYHYQGPPERENLIHFLAAQQVRTDFLESPPSDVSLEVAYLTCRRLSRPLPWLALLESLSNDERARYPRLNRLYSLLPLIRPLATEEISARTLPQTISKLNALLNKPEIGRIAADAGLATPVRTLVLVEGETEKMLLPIFAERMRSNFHALGIELMTAGGKNAVPALYTEIARELKIPICIVLDQDAEAIADELSPVLRPNDALFRIAEGEFEDTYDMALVLEVINHHYQPYPEVTDAGFNALTENRQGRVQSLKAVWQAYGLGSFDKITFARQYAELFQQACDPDGHPLPPPETIRNLLNLILALRKRNQNGKTP